METMETSINPKYMTINQWVERFGYIPKGGLRHLIFTNAEFNRRVVKRLGRKVLLDVQELENFISGVDSNTQISTNSYKKSL